MQLELLAKISAHLFWIKLGIWILVLIAAYWMVNSERFVPRAPAAPSRFSSY